MDRIKIKEAIVVEGRYDAHMVRACVDATVIELKGFSFFKNRKLASLLDLYARTKGLIILTDSDSAGFMIRNRLKGRLDGKYVKNAYIPRVEGKERRKKHRSAEGLLGVEGMDKSVIINALKNAGATVLGEESKLKEQRIVTKADLYEDGLFGGRGSRALRKMLADSLGLPPGLNINALADAINGICGYDGYKRIVNKIKSGVN
jgi:ribonuclease M5